MSAGQRIPSLQELAACVVAARIEEYECPTLPFGCGWEMVRRLAVSGRLRAETLSPLLRSFSVVDDLETELGQPLTHLALNCRGGSALAAQVLRARHDAKQYGPITMRSSSAAGLNLPDGSRIPTRFTESCYCDLRIESTR